MTRFFLKYRSELLMCAYVALVLASPSADSNPHLGGIIALLILLVMLAGSSYMANRKIIRTVAVPLAAVWIIARIAEAVGDNRQLYTQMAPVAGLALSVTVLWAILDRFDSIPQVNTGVLSEAFICYLVLGTAFSQVYCILNRFVQNPFNLAIPAAQTSTFLYFSMITLSTIGYGGITPINPYVRLVAGLEGMTGVFFIAVVVARLVSAYGPRRKSQEGTPTAAVTLVCVNPGEMDQQSVATAAPAVPLAGSAEHE